MDWRKIREVGGFPDENGMFFPGFGGDLMWDKEIFSNGGNVQECGGIPVQNSGFLFRFGGLIFALDAILRLIRKIFYILLKK